MWASAKSGCRRMASRNSAATSLLSAPLRPSRQAEDVVRFCSAPRAGVGPPGERSRQAPGEGRRWRCPSRASARRRREVQPGFELSQRLVHLARAKIRDAEVDINGGRRRQQRDRALQACPRPRQITVVAQGGSEKRMAGSGGGIEADAPPQFGQRAVLRAAVPQRDTEVVVSLGGARAGARPHARDERGQRRDLPAGPE